MLKASERMNPSDPDEALLLSCSFGTTKPVFAHLPNVVTRMSSEIVRLVSKLTESRPGFWPLSPPYDTESVNVALERPESSAKNPFRLWTSPRNQTELMRLSDTGTNISGTLLLDAKIPKNQLERHFGELFIAESDPLTRSMWDSVVNAIEKIQWVGIPYTADADWIVFIASHAREKLIGNVIDWCRGNKISCSSVRERDGKVVVENHFDETVA